MDALGHHSWRGNVRELKNAVERLLIMVEDDEVGPEHLEDVLRRTAEEPASAPAAAGIAHATSRRRAERAFLVQKLRESGWNISATANAIGTPALEPLQEARGTTGSARRRTASGGTPTGTLGARGFRKSTAAAMLPGSAGMLPVWVPRRALSEPIHGAGPFYSEPASVDRDRRLKPRPGLPAAGRRRERRRSSSGSRGIYLVPIGEGESRGSSTS